MIMKKKTSESFVKTRYVVMPNDANPLGTAFGGKILEWMDITAAMVAEIHSEGTVVTAAMDSVIFLCPIRVGEHAVLEAYLTYVGKRSMEVKVTVYRESPFSKIREIATMAYVALISTKDCSVHQLDFQEQDDIKMFNEAALRMEKRKSERKHLEKESKFNN